MTTENKNNQQLTKKDNIRHVELGGLAISDAIKLNFADRLKYLKNAFFISGTISSVSYGLG